MLFVLASGTASAERKSGSVCAPRVPQVSLENAIAIAKEANGSSDESFVDMAILECKANKASWKIGFRNKKAETGHLIVSVQMDGTATTAVVKDG